MAEEIDWDTIDDSHKTLTLEGIEVTGKVVKVYDGDTVHIVLPVLGDLYRWTCRIEGVDTPEIKTKSAEEKTLALAARDALRERILNQLVTVRCGKMDKYGRLLVYITHDDVDISTWLIDNGHAHAYGGGTKQAWT